MKTPEEIQALKDNWLNDPCYDLEETEGFHHHKQELLYFREEKESEWAQKESDRIHERAHALGVPVETMEEIEALETNKVCFTERAKVKLIYYLAAFKPNGCKPFTADEIRDIGEIVDHIILAATITVELQELKKTKDLYLAKPYPPKTENT